MFEVYTLKHKNEVFKRFQEWQAAVEKSSGLKVKTLRSDNGGEYTSIEFTEYLTKEGIKQELTIPHTHTPQQNGLAERSNQTIANIVQTMLYLSGLPPSYWANAAIHAAYLINRIYNNTLSKIPYETIIGKSPNLQHLNFFGSRVMVKKLKKRKSKLDHKVYTGIFIGYTGTYNNIKYVDILTGKEKTVTSLNFDEAHY